MSVTQLPRFRRPTPVPDLSSSSLLPSTPAAALAAPALPLPADSVRPDYGRDGLYGLASSLRSWLHTPTAGWAAGGVAAGDARAVVVLLVVDGLGDRLLCSAGAGSVLHAHRVGAMTSVCPSTTASAVTTLLTGVAPAEHGLNGWHIHDRRFGGVITPLPLTRRGGPPLSAFRLLPRLFPVGSMFHHACRPVNMVAPADIAYSPFSLHHGRGAHIEPYAGLAELGERIVDMVDALADSGGLVHAYYPQFDALSHTYGSRSAAALGCFAQVDALFAGLLDALAGRGVHVVVTADHGFIDTAPARTVEVPPGGEVAAMLDAPLFGERRLAFCRVRRGAEAAFEAWAGEALAGRAVCVRGADFVAAGLLGPGKPHPRLAERVGTHVLLMEPGWTVLDWQPDEVPHAMIGVHGGLSADEMWVPLVRVRT